MAEKTLIIIIDALGYDLLDQMSFSFNLPKEPVRLVPPYGFGEAALMWSGEFPEKTGRWNEFKYNPELSPFRWTRFLPLKPFDILTERFSFKVLSLLNFILRRGVRAVSEMRSRMSLLTTHKIPFSKLRYFLPVHDWETFQLDSLNGHKTLFCILKEHRIRHCYVGYPEIGNDYDVFKKTKEAIKQHQLTISFFSQLDAIEHWNGKDSAEVNKKLKELSGYINELVKIFKKDNPGGNIIIFSDHGMAKVEKTINVKSAVKRIGLKDGTDYLAFYDATMARFWFLNPESKIKIIRQLETIEEGRILHSAELKEAGLNFKDNAFGDLIFATLPGVMVSPNYFQGARLFQAVHGHCPPSRNEHGFFLTDKDVNLDDKIRMENLFSVILNIMNINFEANK
jgi:hypothetical protein